VVQVSPQGKLLGAVVVGKSPRAMTIDGRGFLWAGGHGTTEIVKINTSTRQIVSRISGLTCPYGAATDASGNVWVLNRCRNAQQLITQLNKINTRTNALAGVFQAPGAYGIAASRFGLIWVASFEKSCVYRFTMAGRNLGCTSIQGRGRCVAVDTLGHAWVAGSHTTGSAPNTNGQTTTRYVAKVSPSGRLIGSYTNVGGASRGHSFDLIFASRASRRPSPSRLKASTVMLISSAGKISSWG